MVRFLIRKNKTNTDGWSNPQSLGGVSDFFSFRRASVVTGDLPSQKTTFHLMPFMKDVLKQLQIV